MISNNKHSLTVASSLPFFVRNRHPQFVRFLEAYYEYMEQEGKVLNHIKNQDSYIDIDRTIDVFAERMYQTFLKLISQNILVDKALLLKHIKDFYRARGTQKSVEFLLRAMFDEEIEFYYPSKDVLRASDGKWYVQKSLRISNLKIDGVNVNGQTDLEKFIGTRITGETSGAKATIERVDRFYESGTQVDELVLSNIYKDFSDGETISALFDDHEVSGRTISARIFSGIVNSIEIKNGGSLYEVGTPVVLISNTGIGAVASVAQVSTGNVAAITILQGGAGYRASVDGDFLLISGGGGSGANARLSLVQDDDSVHPSSYNIDSTIINLEANTPIGNGVYSNLFSGIANASSEIGNTLFSWTFANTGPARQATVIIPGSNYTSSPSLSVLANTKIQSLGILGEMSIINGGSDYQIGDELEFSNIPGGYGVGAKGVVWDIDEDSSNAISAVRFTEIPGFTIGGLGYSQLALPTVNVISGTGTGASIIVKNLLGSGATAVAANTTIGSIERIVITSGGSGYIDPPAVDLTGFGDGKANAESSIIRGTFSYPGRYLNDDGHLSSYNFLQDAHYYQSFSYVIRTKISIDKYRQELKSLTHPAGTKLFGEVQIVDSGVDCHCDTYAKIDEIKIVKSSIYSYDNTSNTLVVTRNDHGLESGEVVSLEFYKGNIHNVAANTEFQFFKPNGLYSVATVDDTNNISFDLGFEENVSSQASGTGNVYIGINRTI